MAFARRLRRQSTWAERTLWNELRARRFAQFKLRRQHPVGAYVLDFYCARAKLAIELDGDPQGEPTARRHDQEKDRCLAQRGIRLLRFWNFELYEEREAVLVRIFKELQAVENPHPDPLPCETREREHGTA